MAEYQLVATLPGMEPQTVQRTSDGAFIPFDPANRDYQEYLAWCEEGNVADPAAAPTAGEFAGTRTDLLSQETRSLPTKEEEAAREGPAEEGA